MPRSEARVFTSIWKDPHFTGIDPAEPTGDAIPWP
jgi:hypothetical protein